MHIRPGLLQHTCMWRGARVFLHCSGIALSHHARRLSAADTRKVVPPLSHNDCPDWPCHVLGFGLDSLNTETAGRPYKRKRASTHASRTQLSASTRMNLRRLYPCESPLPWPQPGVDMVCLYCDTVGRRGRQHRRVGRAVLLGAGGRLLRQVVQATREHDCEAEGRARPAGVASRRRQGRTVHLGGDGQKGLLGEPRLGGGRRLAWYHA